MEHEFKNEKAALKAFAQLIKDLDRIEDSGAGLPASVWGALDQAKRDSTYGKRVWVRYVADSTDSYDEALRMLNELPAASVVKDAQDDKWVKCIRLSPTGQTGYGWTPVGAPSSLRDAEFLLQNYGPIMVLPEEDKEN